MSPGDYKNCLPDYSAYFRCGTNVLAENKWRKRVRVERTGDRLTCRPPVLKTGRITGPHALPSFFYHIRLISVRSSSSYQRLINKVGHGPQPRQKLWNLLLTR